MRGESIIAVLAAVLFAVAMFVLGVVMLADEWDLDINVQAIGGGLIAGLGFVGLAAILWHVVRDLME